MSSTILVDPEAIANLRSLCPDDGDAFLKEILSIFIDDTPARIAELRTSLAEGNVQVFVRAAHSIKGSSSNVGASELRSAAEKLEHLARTQGLSNVAQPTAELEACFQRAKIALLQLVAA